MKKLAIGNEIIVEAALAAGAEIMFGYPITPTTEIMSFWTKISEKEEEDKIKFLQAEDEMAAGFMLIGGVLAGKICFTATAGPGNVLLQDPMSMAEAMRLPTVVFIMQRGGPSTGTVIYSQQELLLTTHGGNGEGMRIVYAPATLQELYELGIKAFKTAWQYRFPAFVLGDGYLSRMQGEVNIPKPKEKIKTAPYLGANKDLAKIKEIQPTGSFALKKNYANLRNCYNLEEEIFKVNNEIKEAYTKIIPRVLEHETYHCEGAETIVIAFGIVAAAVKDALKDPNLDKVGLFRPITLQPFPQKRAWEIANKAKKIIVLESALGQLESIVKTNLYGLTTPLVTQAKPALGFTPKEIRDIISKET